MWVPFFHRRTGRNRAHARLHQIGWLSGATNLEVQHRRKGNACDTSRDDGRNECDGHGTDGLAAERGRRFGFGHRGVRRLSRRSDVTGMATRWELRRARSARRVTATTTAVRPSATSMSVSSMVLLSFSTGFWIGRGA
ncbi:MAG: hypothetical protein AAF346_00985 [Pseudomonadota bacterium]